jgi:hypothetical protein
MEGVLESKEDLHEQQHECSTKTAWHGMGWLAIV